MTHHIVIGGNGVLVLDELVQNSILVVGDAGLERDGFLGGLENLRDFRDRGLQFLGQLMNGRLAAQAFW
jgi:hypothetical protein